MFLTMSGKTNIYHLKRTLTVWRAFRESSTSKREWWPKWIG